MNCKNRVTLLLIKLKLTKHIQSPLLASLLGQGERGVSLPLPLTDIRLLVAFIQGEEVGKVTEGVSDMLDIIWREEDIGGSVKEEVFTALMDWRLILLVV